MPVRDRHLRSEASFHMTQRLSDGMRAIDYTEQSVATSVSRATGGHQRLS